MENSGYWNKQRAADYLFGELITDPKKRLIKLNNWITRKHLPKKCYDKVGKEIIIFGDILKQWIDERKQRAA